MPQYSALSRKAHVVRTSSKDRLMRGFSLAPADCWGAASCPTKCARSGVKDRPNYQVFSRRVTYATDRLPSLVDDPSKGNRSLSGRKRGRAMQRFSGFELFWADFPSLAIMLAPTATPQDG
jgi:hypothetical protein